MKVIWIIVSLLISFSCVASEKEILEIMMKQQTAWNKGDLDGFMQGYWRSDKLQFVGKKGIKSGWQTTLDNYKKSYPDKESMGQLTFDILQVEINGDNAFVLGRWTLKRKTDNPNGFYTLYWKKINHQWKIVIDHSS